MKTVLDCGLALRPADTGDLPFIADCIKRDILASVTPEEAELEETWSDVPVFSAMDSLLQRKMSDEVFILGEQQGMLWMGTYVDPYTASPTGYLLGIFLSPELRGKGLGKELMECAEQWCLDKGMLTMQMSVGAANARALDLYGSFGYEPRMSVLTKQLKR